MPGNWTMQGWDKPHYTNVQMPFKNEPPRDVRQWAEIILNRLEQENKLSGNDPMPEKITVNPDKIVTENHRELGPCLVAKKAWESLGLDETLSGAGIFILSAYRRSVDGH